jgi:hypothetical protein
VWPFKKKAKSQRPAERGGDKTIEVGHFKFCPTCKSSLRIIRFSWFGTGLWCSRCEYEWSLCYRDHGTTDRVTLEVGREDLPGAIQLHRDW